MSTEKRLPWEVKWRDAHRPTPQQVEAHRSAVRLWRRLLQGAGDSADPEPTIGPTTHPHPSAEPDAAEDVGSEGASGMRYLAILVDHVTGRHWSGPGVTPEDAASRVQRTAKQAEAADSADPPTAKR